MGVVVNGALKRLPGGLAAVHTWTEHAGRHRSHRAIWIRLQHPEGDPQHLVLARTALSFFAAIAGKCV